ncbi:MAG TPA: tetratricopeptide repeat protein [Candidatus Angelobacter sp.]
MQGLFCTVLSLLLFLAPSTVTVSGRILDRSAKPVSNAKVVYAGPSKDRNYTGTTDAKGQFEISGVVPGSYEVTITDQQGSKIYSGKTDVWRGTDDQPNAAIPENSLLIDLSKAAPSWAGSSASAANMAQVQQNEQAERLRQTNANALKTNELMAQLKAQREAHDWSKTAETLQQLIALYPDRWQYHWNLGDAQANLGRYEEAARSFAKAAELAQKTQAGGAEAAQNSDIGAILLSQGDAYARLGKQDQAMALYNQAAPLIPQAAQAYYRLCSVQTNLGNAAAAMEACNQAITLDPNQWEPYQLLAGAQDKLGKSREALQTYGKGADIARKGMAAKPDAQTARAGLGQLLTAKGNLYLRMERFDEAIATFAEAAASSPNPALPQYNLCAVHFNRGNVSDAIAACDKAIAADPNMADAYYVKGAALFGMGRLEYGKYVAPPQTRETLNKYLGLSPSGPRAEAVRGMLDKLGPELEASKKQKKH